MFLESSCNGKASRQIAWQTLFIHDNQTRFKIGKKKNISNSENAFNSCLYHPSSRYPDKPFAIAVVGPSFDNYSVFTRTSRIDMDVENYLDGHHIAPQFITFSYRPTAITTLRSYEINLIVINFTV